MSTFFCSSLTCMDSHSMALVWEGFPAWTLNARGSLYQEVRNMETWKPFRFARWSNQKNQGPKSLICDKDYFLKNRIILGIFPPNPNLQSHLVCAGITFVWTTTRHGGDPLERFKDLHGTLQRMTSLRKDDFAGAQKFPADSRRMFPWLVPAGNWRFKKKNNVFQKFFACFHQKKKI